MAEMIELSTLDFNDDMDFHERDSGGSSGLRSTNFGGGIELLMNDKVKEGSGRGASSDINIDDLNNLEEELNNLADDSEPLSFSSKSDFFSSGNGGGLDEKHSVRFDAGLNEGNGPSISLGESTAKTGSEGQKTWDGYGKFNNIPINPDKAVNSQPKLSKEELLREKFKFLRKLEALEKKGVELSKKYSMDSPLEEMQGEYETIMEEKMKSNSVKFQGNMMMAVINGIEFLNNRFDPFDIKLDGWSEQINENITDYDEIFGELYEKYKSRASMAPELKLMFQLGGSAMMVHMTNTMFKSAMPGMDDILRQNPDLMRSFQNAAVNSMAGSSPGFSGFMSNMMNPEPEPQYGRGPPPPMATQGPNAMPPPSGRPGNNNYASRPDLNAGQGSKSNSNFTGGLGNSIYVDDGINIRENYASTNSGPSFQEPIQPAQRSKRPQTNSTGGRPEMKGPSDISDILSGLKTKTINIQEPRPPSNPLPQPSFPSEKTVNLGPSSQNELNDSSTISISDLKELQSSGNIPKRTNKRKQKSDKNTISLDI
jgi:hypothetical protein